LSGGTWQSGAPLTNLQNRYLAYKTRSVGLTSDNTQFTVDLQTNRQVQVIAIPRHNMSLAATYNLTLTNTAGTVVYSLTGQKVFGQIYQFGTLPFEHPSWYSGQITQENWYYNRVPLLVILPSAVLARTVYFRFFDTTNTAGYIELNRLIVAPGYQPTVNIKFGAQIGVDDPTVVTTSMGQVDYFDQRTKRRTAVVSIDYLPEQEAFAEVLDLQMTQGLSGQIFFSYNPSDSVSLARHSFLATLSKLDPLQAAAFGYQSATFTLHEVVG
jgi:hypothetical protein